jgi:FMN phosphatase YigB (HAD superfamily)
MKIFLDFDDTVFNTKKFKEEIVKIFSNNGVSKDEFDKTYCDLTKTKKGLYDPRKHLELMNWPQKSSYKQAKKDFDDLFKKLNQYIFDDFYDFVKKFEKKNLFLISFGNSYFQKKKIKSSGIEGYFKKIKIVEKNNKGSFIKKNTRKGEQVFLIDDRPEQLEKAKNEISRLILIRMKRKDSRYNNLENNADVFEAEDLNEAEKIIKNPRFS